MTDCEQNMAGKLPHGEARLTLQERQEPSMYDWDISSNAERLVAFLLAVVIVAVLAV
jgi:hypothetical protein